MGPDILDNSLEMYCYNKQSYQVFHNMILMEEIPTRPQIFCWSLPISHVLPGCREKHRVCIACWWFMCLHCCRLKGRGKSSPKVSSSASGCVACVQDSFCEEFLCVCSVNMCTQTCTRAADLCIVQPAVSKCSAEGFAALKLLLTCSV